MKRIIFTLVAFFTIHLFVFSQDTIKAKILEAGQDAEKAYNNGISNFSSKNFSGAIADFTQAITLKTDFEKAYYNRGLTYSELKDYTNAVADFNKSMELNPAGDYS